MLLENKMMGYFTLVQLCNRFCLLVQPPIHPTNWIRCSTGSRRLRLLRLHSARAAQGPRDAGRARAGLAPVHDKGKQQHPKILSLKVTRE